MLGFARRTCDIPTKDVFSPPNAPGSVLMSVGNADDSVSILLIPQVRLCCARVSLACATAEHSAIVLPWVQTWP